MVLKIGSEAAQVLERLARHCAHTEPAEGVPEPLLTNCKGVPEVARALKLMVSYGKFRVVREQNGVVYGYWRGDDPEKRRIPAWSDHLED